MISKPLFNKVGQEYRKVTVTAGRNSRITRNFNREPGWSDKTYNRKLQDFESSLRLQLENGELRTRKEAQEAKRREEAEKAKLKTLRQYAEGVFMPIKELSISENTRSSYWQFLEKHIYPVLGDIFLKEITSAKLKKFFLDFQKQDYSHATAVKLYNIMNGIFKMAFEDDSIDVNPMLKVQRPERRKDNAGNGDTHKAYTIDEVRYILSCIKQEPLKWQVYICLMVDTGMRRGEVCGLQWEDIDFQTLTIHIRHNLQYTKAHGIYDTTPKNDKTRKVDIGQDIADLLVEHRRKQAAECFSPYVFSQDSSRKPMNPQSPTRYFKKLEKKYNIKDFHPHKLRHTSATIQILNGADIVSVSERLGHSDTAVTLRMYAHSNEEAIRRAGQIAREALGAASQ